MKHKFFAFAAAFVFLLGAVGAISAQKKTNNQLAAQLPASDGVVTLDVKRILNESAPQILTGRPELLGLINQKIDEIREKTGLDARQFEQIAVGLTIKQIGAKEVDFEPLFLTRGKFNANALIAVAKLASDGKYREEKIGTRTVYVFTVKEIAAQNKPQTKNSWLDAAIDRAISGLSREIAVGSFDGNTLAFGSLEKVRETFMAKARVSNELLRLTNKNPNAVMSFAANLPNGLSAFIDLDNDELGTTLSAIRQVSGAIEIAAANTNVSVTAKTTTAEQAQNLKDTLDGLQILGKALLGGKSEEKKVYTRMIDNAKFTLNQTEVSLDLQVPQSDINILLAGVK